MEKPTCGTCPFWEHSYGHGEKPLVGVCHRFPMAEPTGAAHWCGEHPDFPAYLASIGRSGNVVPPLSDEPKPQPGDPNAQPPCKTEKKVRITWPPLSDEQREAMKRIVREAGPESPVRP